MKRFLFSALLLTLAFPSLASAQANSVSLTTYYPAPFGAYDRMQLVPRASLGALGAACGQEGTLYIPTGGSGDINQCKAATWQTLGGGIFKMTQVGAIDPFDNFGVNIDQYTTIRDYSTTPGRFPYVGIGTQNPLKPLHIVFNSNSTPTLIALDNNDPSNGSGAKIAFYGPVIPVTYPIQEKASFQHISLIDAITGRFVSNMIFHGTNGRTSLPTILLNISGQLGGNLGIRQPQTPATAYLEINGKNDPDDYFQITRSDSNPNTSGDVFTVLGVSGNVGINQRLPTAQLEVGGDIKATTLILTSDAGLKKDIVPVTGALDKISRLKGVTFEWKDTTIDTKKHMGVLAQDVEKIFPDAVHGKEGAKGVDYPSLLAPLIEAVKELKDQNDVLSQQLQAQSSQILQQQQKIDSLQKSLESKEPALNP